MSMKDELERTRLCLIEARRAAFTQRMEFEEKALADDIALINAQFGVDDDAVPMRDAKANTALTG